MEARDAARHLPGHRTGPPPAYHSYRAQQTPGHSILADTDPQSINHNRMIRIIPVSKVAGGGNFLSQGAHGSESKYTVDAGDKGKQNPV